MEKQKSKNSLQFNGHLSYAVTYFPPNKSKNQDSWFADDSKGLYLVADGTGGARNSELASQLVVQTIPELILHDHLERVDAKPPDLIRNAIRKIAIKLHDQGKADSTLAKIATTLTLLLLHQQKYYFANVGDSRGYLFRNGHLQQITDDHSVAFEQYKCGAISKDAIQSHPNQRLLTRCLTAAKDFTPVEIFQGEIQSNDLFLLCTDGLSKEVTDVEIEVLLNLSGSDKEIPGRLLEKVVSGKGKDDTTIIAIWGVDK